MGSDDVSRDSTRSVMEQIASAADVTEAICPTTVERTNTLTRSSSFVHRVTTMRGSMANRCSSAPRPSSPGAFIRSVTLCTNSYSRSPSSIPYPLDPSTVIDPTSPCPSAPVPRSVSTPTIAWRRERCAITAAMIAPRPDPCRFPLTAVHSIQRRRRSALQVCSPSSAAQATLAGIAPGWGPALLSSLVRCPRRCSPQIEFR